MKNSPEKLVAEQAIKWLNKEGENSVDLTGKQINQWTVLRFAGHAAFNRENGKVRVVPMWLCRCVCGVERVRRQSALVGWYISNDCGCIGRKRLHAGLRTHGATRTAEYKVWTSMKQRCSVDIPRHKNYAGRGICVCKRWDKFENFLKDMGKRPSPKHSIDRIDNDGDYKPSNCRWATRSEQQFNRRCRSITADGKSLSIREWSELKGISAWTICRRLRLGWDERDAINAPTRR